MTSKAARRRRRAGRKRSDRPRRPSGRTVETPPEEIMKPALDARVRHGLAPNRRHAANPLLGTALGRALVSGKIAETLTQMGEAESDVYDMATRLHTAGESYAALAAARRATYDAPPPYVRGPDGVGKDAMSEEAYENWVKVTRTRWAALALHLRRSADVRARRELDAVCVEDQPATQMNHLVTGLRAVEDFFSGSVKK